MKKYKTINYKQMKKENKIDVASCFEIKNIDTASKEVVFELLKSDVINAQQLIESVKSQNPDIDFSDYKYYKIL